MDVDKLNFIKKSFIDFNGKTEKVIIYRNRGETDFHFEFKCPKCGENNDFTSELKSEKRKIEGKNKEVYIFNCAKCGNTYSIERLKPSRVSSKK